MVTGSTPAYAIMWKLFRIGLTKHNRDQAINVANIPEDEFEEAVENDLERPRISGTVLKLKHNNII